jgi:hypothetical protein
MFTTRRYDADSVQGLGGPRGRSGRALTLPRFDPKTVELLTGRYTDCHHERECKPLKS